MPAAERSIPVTAPLLATRDALASALSAVYVDHPMWTHKGAVWTCRCGASLGRFNDPVTSKPIEPLPLWHAHVAEVQAGALAGVVRDPATLADDDALVERIGKDPEGRVVVRHVLRALAALTADNGGLGGCLGNHSAGGSIHEREADPMASPGTRRDAD